MSARILILAYGNPLRSDDGVAWRSAELLAEKHFPPDVEILRLHQLAPELADTLRGFKRVIFIDTAWSEKSDMKPGTVQIQEIAAETLHPVGFSHAFSPQKVLGLAQELYGIRPQAFIVTVKGSTFDHGDALSPAVADALPELISTIERVVRDAMHDA